MTDPHEMIAAISNLERELRNLGWQPVEMMDEASGKPFTRWFPPQSPPVDHELLPERMDFPPNFENAAHPLEEDC